MVNWKEQPNGTEWRNRQIRCVSVCLCVSVCVCACGVEQQRSEETANCVENGRTNETKDQARGRERENDGLQFGICMALIVCWCWFLCISFCWCFITTITVWILNRYSALFCPNKKRKRKKTKRHEEGRTENREWRVRISSIFFSFSSDSIIACGCLKCYFATLPLLTIVRRPSIHLCLYLHNNCSVEKWFFVFKLSTRCPE